MTQLPYQLNMARQYVHDAKLGASEVRDSALSPARVVEILDDVINHCEQAVSRIREHVDMAERVIVKTGAAETGDDKPDAAYLRDLAERLMNVPPSAGVDQADVDRLECIASKVEVHEVLTPTPSLALYTQMVGRAIRQPGPVDVLEISPDRERHPPTLTGAYTVLSVMSERLATAISLSQARQETICVGDATYRITDNKVVAGANGTVFEFLLTKVEA